ncbi:DUF3997 domain-containing protein [Flavobacterium psychrophilum]|uniref:DUF3997 domain-containing protein n=1 Tax=Flavobacterium psychrophilum TaxID=96345 RepID=UPI000B7C435A|nr:DUF3997 domain-containing protein [Flavobacterium psychrophilum]ELM3645169.1 DUF3997 domain-containing protein [Flavobacterium psychrophilum]MBF2092277.1 DUF3997 domain-containing protein [Flavobacterium psychrophilum]MCB6089630.1 DUF3997 domain-containing protein [Flavobacterium psychrophilum]MCB6232225.1 DUF3997 domain-containing protein [Flavobacterium psychrophilum]SNA71133.1 conserved hypothetical protein [Flavobacterium psychrophilum]
MKKNIKYFFVIISITCFNSCKDWDGTKELTSGYFFSPELNDISSDGKGIRNIEIQPNVLRYNYNDDFIIAEQKPNKINDAIYEKVYDYKDGRNNIYYWIILVKQDSLLGPLSKSEFKQEKIKYNIPNDLVLKRID